MGDKNAKEIILKKICQSKDETLGKGTYFRGKPFLHDIRYPDVMDLVLYYISLQGDLDQMAIINTFDFSRLSESAIREWAQRIENQWEWGTVKIPRYYGSKEMQERPMIWNVSGAWTPEPGPMGETMSCAENYDVLRPGFRQREYLLEYFRYPKGLSKELTGNWPVYKKICIEDITFPKWRRKMHQKRLITVFDLAESICQEMRRIRREQQIEEEEE